MSQERFKREILPMRQQLLMQSLKMLSDEQDAEDVVQETLLKIWNQRSSLVKYENAQAFTMTVCKNLCIDRLRSRKYNDEIEQLNIEDENKNPHQNVEISDEVNLIKTIIHTLPTLQQMIITMKDVDEYEISEIAEITGAKIEAVRMNLSRARKKVREEFIKLTKR